MSEKYSIEELIVRFLQQDINEDELRYLEVLAGRRCGT